jgi:putrescine aminotransferase
MQKRYGDQEIMELERDGRRLVIPHFADAEELGKGAKVFVRGEGCYLWDVRGRRYLDTFASLLTTICGHHRPEVDQAIRDQLDSLEFFPNYVDTFTVPLIALARKIAAVMPGGLEVSFFVNSGSEANETALKMAWQYHGERGEKTRTKVLYRRSSYHGITLGGLSVTGLPWFRECFEPALTRQAVATPAVNCARCELGAKPESCGLLCARTVEELIRREGPETFAAFIMDPLPGSNSGYPVPPEAYLPRIREICDRYGILLVFDEVQTGFGKTGRMFVCEHWNTFPDIMAIGKGFTGGYIPLAAAVTTERIASVFRSPGHEFRSGSTYGGHTLACAATLANIEVIEREGLVARAERMGRYLLSKLDDLGRKHRLIGRVSGMGLLQALFLVRDAATGEALDASLKVGSFIREHCYRNGMILRNNGDILVFAPALIVTEAQIDEIIGILDGALVAAAEHFAL